MTSCCDKRFIIVALILLFVTMFVPGCKLGSSHLQTKTIPFLSGSKKPSILFLDVAPDEQHVMVGQRINSQVGADTIPVIYVHHTTSKGKHSFEAASALTFSGVFLDNGQKILACDKKGVTFMRLNDGHSENFVPRGRARLVSPRGDAVACLSHRGQWRIYSTQTQSILCELPDHVDQVIAFSPVDACVACSVKPTEPQQSGSAKIVFFTFRSEQPQAGAGFELDYYASNHGLFSPDGRYYATIRSTGSVGIWEVATGKLQHSINDIEGVIQSLAFSPDGTELAIGVQDQTAKMFTWNTHNNKIEEVYSDRYCEAITAIRYARSGEKIYFGDANGNVKTWSKGSKRAKKIL